MNSHTAPIGYVTNEVVSEKNYQTLDFPVNQSSLLWKAVAESAEGDADFPAKKIRLKKLLLAGVFLFQQRKKLVYR